MIIQTQTGWGRTLKSFAAWCKPQAGWRTLDVGCGPGLLPAILAREGCRSFGLDLEVLASTRLHPHIALADALNLPFPVESFDLVTASNLLFFLPNPLAALLELARIVRQGGQVAVLNPSEHLSVASATILADQHGLEGVARDSLINWGQRAEDNRRWSKAEVAGMFSQAGLQFEATTLKIGPGLARLARGTRL